LLYVSNIVHCTDIMTWKFMYSQLITIAVTSSADFTSVITAVWFLFCESLLIWYSLDLCSHHISIYCRALLSLEWHWITGHKSYISSFSSLNREVCVCVCVCVRAWFMRAQVCVTKLHTQLSAVSNFTFLFVAHVGRWWVAGVWGREKGLHRS